MKTLLILCGGKSEEHEISLISAKAILNALDPGKYVPLVVGISKQGQWYLCEASSFYVGELRADKIKLNTKGPLVSLVPYLVNQRGTLFTNQNEKAYFFDAVFPMLHGTFGEDGTVQGLLELIGIPYVGSGCESSAVCMDKILSKAIARQFDIPVADFVVLKSVDELHQKQKEVEALGSPLFSKPARQGSSVGISKVTELSQLEAAVTLALEKDTLCLLEQSIKGRELECAILGSNSTPEVGVIGEIVPNKKIGWYSYDAKYLMNDGAEILIPASLDRETELKAKALALKTYQVMGCEGMARVDLFLTPDNQLYLNEVNTIPGFTPISMYPKMWQASGLSYQALVDKLIELAFKRNP